MSAVATVVEGWTPEPGGESAPIPLRRNRDFQILWLGQSVAHLGNEIALLAYPLLILEIHGTTALVGVLGFLAYAAGLAARLPAGAGPTAAGPWRPARLDGPSPWSPWRVAVAVGAAPVWLIIVVAVVDSVGLELFRFAERGALRHIEHPHRCRPRSPVTRRGHRRRRSPGRPSGGWLFAVGRTLPFAVNAVTHLLAALAVLTIRRPLRSPAQGSPEGVRGGVAVTGATSGGEASVAAGDLL
ncbi:hypothetical protein [Actinomadura rudentiformis]|uniref:MFS transporter n=1 Tax=Actinomadura rudentiformis TaxID=359158 RepID=A0A6H9YVB4_9ACTN|nr:hypothetical protein [Actinomadura rudentiformis]KAB2344696.1 hypothetical protein F8566_29205 [Actinomadura rudentiformis]